MKFTTLLTTLLICNLNLVFADEVMIDEPLDNEVDRFLDDDSISLDSSMFQTIDVLSELDNVNNAVVLPLKKKKRFKSSEQMRPKKFRAALRKKSILENISTGKALTNRDKIYVTAQEVYIEGKYSYIFDKKGVARFSTLTSNLESVEEELQLHPKIDASTSYVKTENYRATDKVIYLEHHLSISQDYFNVSGLSKTLNREEESATASSLEYRLFHKSFLPLHFGVAAQLQQGSFEQINNTEAPNWSALYLGPLLRYQAYSSYHYNFNFIAGFKRSFYYNVNTDNGSYNFSNTLWNLEMEGVYKTRYGHLSLSLGRVTQSQSFKPSQLSDSDNLSLNNEKQELSATTLSVGYQYEFSL